MAGDEWLISRAAADGGRLRLRFVRRDDRVHQTVEWFDAVAGEFVPLLESREGESSDVWPASPPLQQFLIESRGAAGQVALLVGMAGRSHWSLSVEPLADRVGFRFDAACRLGGPPDWLGNTWRLAPERLLPERLSPGRRVPEGLVPEGLVPERLVPERLVLERIGPGSPAVESDRVVFISTTRDQACEARFARGSLRIVAEDGAECHAESGGIPSERMESPGEWGKRKGELDPSGNSPSECRVWATRAPSVAAAGRFPATVQWRFVVAWEPPHS